MTKIPFSLILDDGGPVNSYCFHDPYHKHTMLVPASFTKKFAEVCKNNKIRGKFSIVPMPGCIGRIDESLHNVPQKNITDFIEIVKNDIMPMFSITPEILTHHLAYNLHGYYPLHVCEDVYFSTLKRDTIAEYVGLALQILLNVGITPSGVTSPWMTGLDNETEYAAGIGMAFKKVMKQNHCFYFLHSSDNVRQPKIVMNSKETGKVVTIPGLTSDPFWQSQQPATARQARSIVQEEINNLLSEDGKTGIIPNLIEKGEPVIFVTHWQSLFSDGRAIGLDGLAYLAQRIDKRYGKTANWLSFAEIEKTVK